MQNEQPVTDKYLIRITDEHETYMLLQDSTNFTLTGNISIPREMASNPCALNGEDTDMNSYE